MRSSARACALAGAGAVALALACSASVAFDANDPVAVTARLVRERAPHLDSLRARGIARAVVQAAREHGVDPWLLLAVIEQESSYRARAVGPKGGRGLMQLRAVAARHVAPRLGLDPPPDARALHDPILNVRLGAAYLQELYARFGDWEAALAAYQMGPAKLRERVREGHTASSRYARRVLARWREIRARAAELSPDGEAPSPERDAAAAEAGG